MMVIRMAVVFYGGGNGDVGGYDADSSGGGGRGITGRREYMHHRHLSIIVHHVRAAGGKGKSLTFTLALQTLFLSALRPRFLCSYESFLFRSIYLFILFF